MTGPWVDFQPKQQQGASGPWQEFAPPSVRLPEGRRAQDLGDAIIAGLQNSATVLALRGRLPSVQMGEDVPWYQRLAAGAAGVVADIPLSAVGAIPGAMGGAAAAGPAAPIGAVVGGGAGAFAAPMALREALIEAYSNDHALSWAGVWEIGKAALKGGIKGAAIGAVTGGAGALVGRAVGSAVAPSVGMTMTGQTAGRVIEGAAVGAELSTLTATSAALEGRLPTWQDFMDNALLLGGMKAATSIAKGMRNVYAETGKTPEQVLADAARDPQLRTEIQDGQRVTLYRGQAAGTEPGYRQGGAVWMTRDKTEAENYAASEGAKGEVISAEVVLRKPFELNESTAGNFAEYFRQDDSPQQAKNVADLAAHLKDIGFSYLDADVKRKLLADGYDSIIVTKEGGVPGKSNAVVLLKPIKDMEVGRTVPPSYEPLALEQRIQAAIDADPRPEMIRQNLAGGKTVDVLRAPNDNLRAARQELQAAYAAYEKAKTATDGTLVDTRGGNERFHGTSAELKALSDDYALNGDNRNIYGQGFYTTDAVDIARGYTKKGRGGSPAIYRVKEHGEPKLFDMEAPLTPEIKAKAKRILGDIYRTENAETGQPIRSLRELYDEARAESRAEGLSRDEVQGAFDSMREYLEQQGYRGFRHVGGSNTGRKAHDVRIYWTPEKDISIERVDAAGYTSKTVDQAKVDAAARSLFDAQAKFAAAKAAQRVEETAAAERAKVDPVKYEYITDNATAKGVLRQVTSMYEQEMRTQTRGVVPNKETAVQGMKMITDGVLSEHIIGQAGNAAEIYARAHLLKGATNHAVGELAKIAGLPDAELTPAAKMQALAALERVAMLKSELEGIGAEAGRSLQIFRAMKRDPSLLGEAETLLKLAERKGNMQDIAALALQLKDPAQLAEFARQYTKATTTEKVIEAWKAAILSGPQTHLANIMGNTTKWLVEVPESAIAATFTAAQRAASGDPLTFAQFKARALAPIYGIQHGAVDALTVAAQVARGRGEYLEKGDVYRTAIEGKTGEVIRLPFKALQVQDALFRTMAERAEAHVMAVDRAVKEGFHPSSAEFRQAVVQYTARPEVGLSEKAGMEAIARVQQAGAEAVFAQRLGPRMETLQRAMAGHWSQFIIPFVRTPTNLVSWAIQHVPGLNLVSGRWREDFAAGGERQARAVARVAIGAGLTAMAYSLASDETFTGGGAFDPEQRRTKAAAGWQPYSVKIGDSYYSYQRMEPVAKVLGIAADLFELQQAATDEKDKAKIATLTVLMFGNMTVSTTYLSGLSNAMNSLTSPERYGENFLEQYSASLVPKIIGQTTAMADPYKREVDGVIDSIQAQLPILRQKLMPKRDVWGEPAQNDRWFAVMPVAKSQISEDKVKTEAVRLQLAIQDAPKFVTERGPFNPKDKRIELSAEQRDIFREVAGKNAMSILGPIVSAPDWDRIPDFAKAEIYKRVLEGTRKQGQYAALPPDDAARVKMREEIVNRVIQETNKAQR